MSKITFAEIAALVNFSRSTQIEPEPFQELKGRWQLHKAANVVHTSRYPFFVVYFQSDATQIEIEDALTRLPPKTPDVHLVYPETQIKNVKKVTDVPRWAHIKNKWTPREFILSFIKGELDSYLSKLRNDNPSDYIDPPVETPSGFPRKNPNPLLGFMTDAATVNQPSNGTLAIVLAEAGQGKTYMSRYLVGQLAKPDSKVVPILVDSSQWRGLTLDDQRSLAKTITHSFRHFGAAISWAEGHEEEFLRITLKADIFRIVFDGFDEYILRNQGNVQPLEVLEALSALAKETESRIIITSRTSFWETNLPESEVKTFFDDSRAYRYVIKAFDANHAANYFKKQLKDVKAQSRAVDLFQRLVKESQEITGRGFVLKLLADLFQDGNTLKALPEDDEGTMLWLLRKLCERETLRQQLPIDADEQLHIFKMFAKEAAEGADADTSLLRVCMQTVCGSLHSKIIEKTIEVFKSHPLLRKAINQDVWSFSQEQILIGLLALQIEEWNLVETQRFLEKSNLEPERVQDLGSLMVDLLRLNGSEREKLKRFQEIITKLSAGWDDSFRPGAVVPEGRRLAGIVALLAVEKLLPTGSQHRSRAEFLRSLMGGSEISRIYFTGTISRYDFRGVKFSSCLFNRVTWINCEFDEATEFNSCKFHGGIPVERCTGFGGVKRLFCKLDPEAEKVFASAEVQEGRRKYSEADLRSDIQALIGKFVIGGGTNLKTVSAEHLNKGTFGHSKYSKDILDVFKSLVIEEHHMQRTGAFNIRPEAVEAVKFYASNNVFTGPLDEASKRLKKKLMKP